MIQIKNNDSHKKFHTKSPAASSYQIAQNVGFTYNNSEQHLLLGTNMAQLLHTKYLMSMMTTVPSEMGFSPGGKFPDKDDTKILVFSKSIFQSVTRLMGYSMVFFTEGTGRQNS